MAGDYTMENVIMNQPVYDMELDCFVYDVSLTAADGQETAVLMTRLYLTYRGLVPPSADEVSVYTDGCTEALAEALEHYFG